jgi:E3 ubiquitin-protein ligase TRIP12
LHPKLTVVKKTPDVATRDEVQLTADQILPSVMTCASVRGFPDCDLAFASTSLNQRLRRQYLKLPDYSSKEVLSARIHQAMTEGAGAFHMS